MNRNSSPSRLKNDEKKEIIVENIKTKKPKTIRKLVKSVPDETGPTERESCSFLFDLENEVKIRLTKKETSLYSRSRVYMFSKKTRWYWITITLAIVAVISVFTISENIYPSAYLRIATGALLILFLPGYSFIKMLFPSTTPITNSNIKIDNFERIALSIGMSFALTLIVGLILNYTPWGIRLASITLSLLTLTVALSTAAVLCEVKSKQK